MNDNILRSLTGEVYFDVGQLEVTQHDVQLAKLYKDLEQKIQQEEVEEQWELFGELEQDQERKQEQERELEEQQRTCVGQRAKLTPITSDQMTFVNHHGRSWPRLARHTVRLLCL
ncbi:hypothetical protein DAPPUDRAFT_118534 [Daphnia pulex]|uniref:Uncharacterized protein n=1 Tax=Daphnia pulex TaxID=6669 RepID=E9HVW2_DAPPU|nr:hypothetical protein DAPPUDRAFT_118534 [Daphnia pulex]|eukprot:EFX64118.1 hypothetical protein DAPPUDRAFT_118534 [Daphnia pulex]